MVPVVLRTLAVGFAVSFDVAYGRRGWGRVRVWLTGECVVESALECCRCDAGGGNAAPSTGNGKDTTRRKGRSGGTVKADSSPAAEARSCDTALLRREGKGPSRGAAAELRHVWRALSKRCAGQPRAARHGDRACACARAAHTHSAAQSRRGAGYLSLRCFFLWCDA